MVFDGLRTAAATHVRVTALADDGLESDPSQTLVGWASAELAEVLLVDGNERWQAEPAPRNTLGAHHDFLVGLAAASGSRRIDSATNHAVTGGAVDLAATVGDAGADIGG